MSGFFRRLWGQRAKPVVPAPTLALGAPSVPRLGAPEPTRASTPEPAAAVNVVGRDMTIHGSLSSSSGLRLAGAIVGDVVVDELMVADGGRIVGTVRGADIVVEGSIEGDVGANKLVIRATGRVQGDVAAKAMVVDEGGALEGRCHMGETRAPALAVSEAATDPVDEVVPEQWTG